jgi:hypothetical protein
MSPMRMMQVGAALLGAGVLWEMARSGAPMSAYLLLVGVVIGAVGFVRWCD